MSPLYWAAKTGLEEVCKHLLDKGRFPLHVSTPVWTKVDAPSMSGPLSPGASCSLGDYSPVESAASGRVRKILREGEHRWRQGQSFTSLNPYCIDTKFIGGD